MNANDVITFIRENPGTVLNAIQKEHRTHQQSIMRSLHKILKEYGKAEYGSDLRNECAIKWANDATSGDHIFPPYI